MGCADISPVRLSPNRVKKVTSTFFVLAALTCLMASGYFCLRAVSPSDHVYPRGEDIAIKYANFYKNEDAAKGRFALVFGDSSEQERFLTNEKGRLAV